MRINTSTESGVNAVLIRRKWNFGVTSVTLKILKNKLREGASICQDADHWGKLTFCHSHACRKWDFGVTSVTLKVVSFLRLFLGEIASGVSGKVGFGVSVKGDP